MPSGIHAVVQDAENGYLVVLDTVKNSMSACLINEQAVTFLPATRISSNNGLQGLIELALIFDTLRLAPCLFEFAGMVVPILVVEDSRT